MYARLEPEVAERALSELRPGAAPCDDYPLDGHPPVPGALVYAREDEFFEPGWERHVARAVLGADGVELAGGHFPMLEDPAGLASVLTKLVP
jgi:pimeloyl-ACP methyl ester carboxylesterase